MRQVRYSTAFIHQLNTLLAQGEAKFGARVADRKRELVYDTPAATSRGFPRSPAIPASIFTRMPSPARPSS
jgi:hypothetical protein